MEEIEIIFKSASETIKTSILQGQCKATKSVNRILLTIYFCIGNYVSIKIN